MVENQHQNNANAAAQKQRIKLASFNLKHDDFVHDVQFDHHGRRIATCSSDQNIKIWERSADIDYAETSYNTGAANATGPEIAQKIADQMSEMTLTNQWVCTFQIPSKHNGSVWRIAWADPEFGQIIASCGMDQHVRIFKERESGQTAMSNPMNRGKRSDIVLTGKTWERAWKYDINAPIVDIKFAPKFVGTVGPVLSVACADGSVRFFQPATPTVINDWHQTFNVIKNFTASCTCLAWNPAFDERAMLLCGFSESSRSRANNPAHTNDVHALPKGPADAEDQYDSQLLLYRLDGRAPIEQFLQYGTEGQFRGHEGSIHDVAWAPLAGRSFHMVASAASDRRIIVWRLQVLDFFSEQPDLMFAEPQVRPLFSLGPQLGIHSKAVSGGYEVPPGSDAQPDGHPQQYHSQVLRLKWNILGTCFAASAEDGTVSVWQRAVNSTDFVKIAAVRSR